MGVENAGSIRMAGRSTIQAAPMEVLLTVETGPSVALMPSMENPPTPTLPRHTPSTPVPPMCLPQTVVCVSS